MPVQNSNSKISAHPDLATQLLQILIPTILNSLLCQKGQFTLQPALEDGLLEKYLVIAPRKSKLEILHRNFCLSKKEVFSKQPVQKTGWKGPGKSL